MAKKKKSSNVFKAARLMGENIGKLVTESKKTVRKGKKGLEYTAETIESAGKKAGKKAKATTQETIPQLVKEYKRGINKGMKKKR